MLDILRDWTLPPWLTFSIVLTGAIYLRGWMAIRKTRPIQFSGLRLASFMGGLVVLRLAIGSPMDGLADALLSAHMLEHLLLMSVVPPLLLGGLPAVPLLRGLPAWLRQITVGPLMRLQVLRHLGDWLVKPVVAWSAMNLSLLLWHIPRAYNSALEHEAWHDIEHLCFLGTSILFWFCVLRPWPARQDRRTWGLLLFLLSADGVNTILSAFLAFCGRPVYCFYLQQPNPFHVAPIEDQVLGAVMMWVLGSMAFLIPAMLLTFRLLGHNNKNQGSRAVQRSTKPSRSAAPSSQLLVSSSPRPGRPET